MVIAPRAREASVQISLQFDRSRTVDSAAQDVQAAISYHLHRTRLELIAELKVRRRQLTDDGNVEITGRDLREREVQARHPRPIGYRRAAS
jgi:hypothetical protein